MTKDKVNPPAKGEAAPAADSGTGGACRYAYQCPHCGSRNIRKDGLVSWNVSAQCWEVVEVYDDANCGDCGAVEFNAIEVPL